MSFNLHLCIEEINDLPVDKVEDSDSCRYVAMVEWRGSKWSRILPGGFERNCTMKQRMKRNGTVRWNEGFDRACKLKKLGNDRYSGWIVKLKVQEIGERYRGKMVTLGEAKVDVAEFAMMEAERSVKVVMNCKAVLTIKLRFTELRTSSSTAAFTLPRALSLRTFSCTRAPQTHSNRFQHPTEGLARNDVGGFDYGKLTMSDFPLVGRFPVKLGDDNGHGHGHRHQSSLRPLRQSKPVPEESLQFEKQKIVSRDGELELVTDVFFASIDQRSDRAAGGGACTVLATVIAHWLHDNPKVLPLQGQLDELVHKGSSEWRKLCENEHHKKRFSDQHFDLETVLEAKVRPLAVDVDKSYIGFFSLDSAVRSPEFLRGAMTFDNVWSEVARVVDSDEERVYIASWNDHFFVVKVERDSIYLIDTLGERLFEGCNRAYVLRFDRESSVYRRRKFASGAVFEGTDSCREYIKGFLAGVPLRELQQEMEGERVEEARLHRKLQIEFHYTRSSRDLR